MPGRASAPGRRLLGLVLAVGSGLGVGSGVAAQPALAQSAALPRDPFEGLPAGPLMRDDAAGARQIPGYVPKGLDLGGVHLQPSVTLRSEASSNVFNRLGASRGDVSASISPALLASGEAGSARFAIDARASLARYARLSGFNSETWSLRGQGSAPLGSGVTLALTAATARRLEPPFEAAGSTRADGGAVLVDQSQAALGARAELGLTRLIAGLEVARSHYLPVIGASGLRVGQGFRDDRVISATLRVEHALGGGHVVFAEGAQRWIRSPHPGLAPDRSGRSGEALLGLRGGVGPLVMAEVAAGYRWRDYRSPAWKDWRGLAWRARVEWYATPLVTFTLASRRDLVNAPLPAAGGVVVDQVSARAFWEARRNLTFVLSASHAVERYRDLGPAGVGNTPPTVRSDMVGIEATYAANRRLQLGLSARYRDRRSGSPFLPRQGHAVEGGVTLRFSV